MLEIIQAMEGRRARIHFTDGSARTCRIKAIWTTAGEEGGGFIVYVTDEDGNIYNFNHIAAIVKTTKVSSEDTQEKQAV